MCGLTALVGASWRRDPAVLSPLAEEWVLMANLRRFVASVRQSAWWGGAGARVPTWVVTRMLCVCVFEAQFQMLFNAAHNDSVS